MIISKKKFQESNRAANNEIYALKNEIEKLKRTLNEKTQALEAAKGIADLYKKQLSGHSETEKLYKQKISDLENQLKPRIELLKVAGSNLTAIPYMAKIIADYETYGIEHMAACLNWGYDQKRLKKVKAIQEIREDARKIVEKNKEAQYQLAYLLELYPALQDVIETDYNELPIIHLDELKERDPAHDFLSAEEYKQLSESDRNQLALDRYIKSHNKSKWQIGRDYELYIGYRYQQNGNKVEYFGSNKGLEDLGRDLIVHKNNGTTLIIQCKYWSQDKVIHEKHIAQLYGTTICYSLENNLDPSKIDGALITNTQLSDIAKRMATYLNIKYLENYPLQDFPRIKCNNGIDQYGRNTKIYHLPFDQQYDRVKMMYDDDFWAFTVKEAEKAGYRRAYRWFGS